MATKGEVNDIEQIDRSLFWIERAVILLFILFWDVPEVVYYCLTFFVANNIFYLLLGLMLGSVAPQPNELMNKVYIFELYGSWLIAVYRFLGSPIYAILSVNVFLISNLILLMKATTPKVTEKISADEKGEKKQKQKSKDRKEEKKPLPKKKAKVNKEMPGTENSVSSKIIVVKEEDTVRRKQYDHGEKLPEEKAQHPENEVEKPETEPEVHHEMEMATSVVKDKVFKEEETVSSKEENHGEGLPEEKTKLAPLEEKPETENLEPEVHREMGIATLVLAARIMKGITGSSQEEDDIEEDYEIVDDL